MYLIITRNFPPEVGGMQNLMWGLTNSLSKLNMVKVFADYHENHIEFDNSKIFRYNESKNITSLDPAFARNLQNLWPIQQIFNSLVQLDDSLNVKPELAIVTLEPFFIPC